MTLPVPLGFSCQSRFTCEGFTPDLQTMPFDWQITTKAFVLSALEAGDGRGFAPEPEDAVVYRMSREGTEGVEAAGLWLWHDFPRTSENALAPGWETRLPALASKYAHLWNRFSSAARDADIPKRFIVTNTQMNLPEFARDDTDFAALFGLDREYAHALTEALESFGARNFTLEFVVRDIEDFLDLVTANEELRGFRARFTGAQTLPAHDAVTAWLSFGCDTPDALSTDPLVGRYSNGATIESLADGSALVRDAVGTPAAVASGVPGGFIVSFVGGTGLTFLAGTDGRTLAFSNNTAWQRVD